MKRSQMKKPWQIGSLWGMFAIIFFCGGCSRVYREFLAWDAAEDVFFDVGEPDPKVGFRLLYGRWESYRPLILPHTSNMQEARNLSGACLVIAYWDQLSENDRRTIVAEASVPDKDPFYYGFDAYDTYKNLTLIKVQIMEKGKASLSAKQKELWDQLSRNFGDRSG